MVDGGNQFSHCWHGNLEISKGEVWKCLTANVRTLWATKWNSIGL